MLQWGTLTVGISHMIWKDNYANMQLSVLSMVEGDFAAGAVLITFVSRAADGSELLLTATLS